MSTLIDPNHQQQHRSRVKHHGKGCLAVIVSLAVLVVGGYFVWNRAAGYLAGFEPAPDYPGPGKASVTVTIPAGTSVADIGQILLDDHVIRSTGAWEKAVSGGAAATSIQAGQYRMETELPAQQALDLLLSPEDTRVRRQVTVPEGLRLSDELPVLAKGTGIPLAKFQAASKPDASKSGTVKLPPEADGNAEGFLFPDSYELTDETTATSLLQEMVDQYDATSAKLDMAARAKSLGVSVRDVVIVASLIEKEVSRPEDRPKVARVLYNRLKVGRKLELNSTLVYARNYRSGLQITDADLRSKNPYNTYVHKGLPPTPISAPGAAALEAAANPTPGDWLFFVTVNCDTGETKFTASESEHLRYVDEYQRSEHPERC